MNWSALHKAIIIIAILLLSSAPTTAHGALQPTQLAPTTLVFNTSNLVMDPGGGVRKRRRLFSRWEPLSDFAHRMQQGFMHAVALIYKFTSRSPFPVRTPTAPDSSSNKGKRKLTFFASNMFYKLVTNTDNQSHVLTKMPVWSPQKLFSENNKRRLLDPHPPPTGGLAALRELVSPRF